MQTIVDFFNHPVFIVLGGVSTLITLIAVLYVYICLRKAFSLFGIGWVLDFQKGKLPCLQKQNMKA